MKIHKGDQYYIPVTITNKENVVTSDDCSDVRIQIGKYLFSYQDGELEYDEINKTWKAFLTEEMSRSFCGPVEMQIGVKSGATYIYSDTKVVDIDNSIIKETWSDEQPDIV